MSYLIVVDNYLHMGYIIKMVGSSLIIQNTTNIYQLSMVDHELALGFNDVWATRPLLQKASANRDIRILLGSPL